MITHYPSLLRAPLPAGAGLRHVTPRTFLFTNSPPPLPPPIRLRPLSAAAGGGSPVAGDAGKRATPPPQPLGAAVLGFARNNFLPLALIGGIALGLLDPTLGCLAHKYSLSKYSTFWIFVISGLTLCTKELGAALQACRDGSRNLTLGVQTPTNTKHEGSLCVDLLLEDPS